MRQPLLIAILFLAPAIAGALPAETWSPAMTVPGDLPVEARYRTERTLDDMEAPVIKWDAVRTDQNCPTTVHRDTAARHGGSASLRVDYAFRGIKGLDYVLVNRPVSLAAPGASLGFWFRYTGKYLIPRIRITDRTGECHQFDMVAQPSRDWTYYAVDLSGQANSWGGDGNGKMDYPCTLSGLCFDKPSAGFGDKGSLWIDDMALVRKRDLTNRIVVEVQGGRFGNVYRPGEPMALRATCAEGQMSWRISDYFGRTQCSGKASGGNAEVGFKTNRPGWYVCTFERRSGDVLEETTEYRMAVLPATAAGLRSDFVGVCTHFGQNAYPLECMDLMLRYGIDQFRDEISWGAFEPERGKLAMPEWGEKYIQYAADRKMRPLIIYDYANANYDGGDFPNSKDAIDGFAHYCEALTAATMGRVKSFEVWNEWIGGCGMGGRTGDHTGEAYGRMLAPAYAAVKRAHPDVTVVGIGGEYGPDCARNIVKAIGTAGKGSMDAYSIHPYRYPSTPEASDLAGEVSRIAGEVKAAGGPADVWVTEVGYPTHNTATGSTEFDQAAKVVRAFPELLATGAVSHCFWYDLKDDGDGRDYNEFNFGLVKHQKFNCAPKPAMVAVAAYIRQTHGARFVARKVQGNVRVALYRRTDGTEVAMAWSPDGPATVSLRGKVRGAVDVMGAPLANQRTVKIGPQPIYVTGESLTVF